MSTPETPLFVKTHDFLLWLIRHTQRFPKNLRQSYTLKLELMAFEFQEAILMANAVRGTARSTWLATADGKLVCLRALLRLAYGLELLVGTQVEHAVQRVDELGRLLGAWKKGTDRQAPVPRACSGAAAGTTSRSSAGCRIATPPPRRNVATTSVFGSRWWLSARVPVVDLCLSVL